LVGMGPQENSEGRVYQMRSCEDQCHVGRHPGIGANGLCELGE
jgi:hypothetical protein